MPEPRNSADLILAPGQFAFVLDTTKGVVNIHVGPTKQSLSNTDQPVLWDAGAGKFENVNLEVAVQSYVNAPEGAYVVLTNPSESTRDDDAHPKPGTPMAAPRLRMGRKVNLPGPSYFALWPQQAAKVLGGHNLRSNQYLVVRVYNDEEAKANWGKAVVKPQTTPQLSQPQGGAGDENRGESGQPPAAASTPPPTPEVAAEAPKTLTMGQLFVIKGTDVSFYIPPTGVEVVPEQSVMVDTGRRERESYGRETGAQTRETYVRDAITLERMEYCILLNENGEKRFVKGPAVVFPEPTETFVEIDGKREFRAVELNENSGIHVKVIAEYEEGGRTFKVGEELFITGKEQAIYFPRPEHSVIQYGDRQIHYAVAVPAGEGRYVLDRNEGKVGLAKGPVMLLPEPRHEVIVRRILTEKQVRLWYPGNDAALQVNQELARVAHQSPADYLEDRFLEKNLAGSATVMRGMAQEAIAADSMKRKTSFTPPRTITLDTKYDGAVSIDVWTGYAVLVVSKTGERRVVRGPRTILLEYDETLMPMELSTGTPKTDERPFQTVYLRTENNTVSDVVKVETRDLVQVDVRLSYRVNFEGDEPEKWFGIENYVKFLTDHLRSLIRSAGKRHGIEEFYGRTVEIVRDQVLGAAPENGTRAGRAFKENGMRVYDVEVLDVKIGNPEIARLLVTAQSEALQGALRISREEQELELTRRSERIKREAADEVAETEKHSNSLEQDKIKLTLETNLARLDAEAKSAVERQKNSLAEQEAISKISEVQLARTKAEEQQKIALLEEEIAARVKELTAETENIVKRAEAVDENLAAALVAFADQALVAKMTEAMAPAALAMGVSGTDILAQLLKGTPFEGTLKALGSRSRVQSRETAKA
jgi:major vault protein